jgi:hypothetical protein
VHDRIQQDFAKGARRNRQPVFTFDPPLNEVAGQGEGAVGNRKGLTLRERTELHKAGQNCVNGHKVLDPIGFGLENFDAIGRRRDQDEGSRIDSAGELSSGESPSQHPRTENASWPREINTCTTDAERS